MNESKLIIFFFFFSFTFCSHVEAQSITLKYLKQFETNSSSQFVDQSILWSLAELAAKLEKTATSQEVEHDITKRISDILERVEVAEEMMREEMTSVLVDIAKTQKKVEEAFSDIRWQIHEGVLNMSQGTLLAIQDVLNMAKETESPLDYTSVKKMEHNLRATIESDTPKIQFVLFCGLQFMFIIGICYYKHLINALDTIL